MTVASTANEPDRAHDGRAARYQRVRLGCGLVGIGGILLFLWFGLLFGLPATLDRWFGTWPAEFAGAITALLLGLVASVIQAGPDVVAARLERVTGQKTGSTALAYVLRLGEWLLGLTVAGLLVGFTMRWAGDYWWLVLPIVLLALAFAHVVYPLSPAPKTGPPRASWWKAVEAELARMELPTPPIEWYDHGERSLAGGWNGVGRLRRLFLAKSLATVSPRVAAGLIAREIGHLTLRHRIQTTLATILWITLGLVLAGLLLPGDWGVPALVFGIAAVMSTWCWLGLLGLWPTVGRRQVLAADRFARDAGLGEEGLAEMLDALAERNLPDVSLPPKVAFVFHPIPPMNDRRVALFGQPFEEVPE